MTKLSGDSPARLPRIIAAVLLAVGLAATCAAASPGRASADSPARPAAAPAAATGVTLYDPGNQIAGELPEAVNLQLTASDSAGGALTYTATGLPPGTSIDPATGLISGTVTDYYAGTASVTATDASGASATVSFNWRAYNAIYVAAVTILQNLPNSPAEYDVEASDPDKSEPLAYSAAGLPPGLSIDPTTGLISGTTTAAIGSYHVTVTVSDPTGSSASISITWRVWNKVTVSVPSVETIQVGAAVSFPVSATDSASGQTLTFSAAGLPAGLSINPASGLITGSASADGVYDVTVTATDSAGSQGSATINWAVLGQAAITSPGNLSTTAGQLVQLPVKVSDTADNAWLDLSIAGGPPGMQVSWDSSTQDGWKSAVLTGWAAPAGTYKTTITVVGAYNMPAEAMFTWTVKPAAGTGPTGPVRLDQGGMCLDDTNNSSANGNKIQIWACNGDAAQNWTYAADGTLRIHGKCLDATGYGTAVGTKLQLYSCGNHTNQLWTPANTSELQGAGSGRCVTYPAGDLRNGVPLELGNCSAGAMDEWTLPAGEIQSGVPGQCLTDSGGGSANGTKIVLGTCTDSSAQRWTVNPDGTIRILGRCLSLTSVLEGAGAVLWACGAASGQQWSFPGTRALTTGITTLGHSLESPVGQTASGTQLVLGAGGEPAANWHVW